MNSRSVPAPAGCASVFGAALADTFSPGADAEAAAVSENHRQVAEIVVAELKPVNVRIFEFPRFRLQLEGLSIVGEQVLSEAEIVSLAHGGGKFLLRAVAADGDAHRLIRRDLGH